MDALGELIANLIPWVIPAVLLISFLMNHGMWPTGGSSSSGKSDGSEKQKGNNSSKDNKPPAPPPSGSSGEGL